MSDEDLNQIRTIIREEVSSAVRGEVSSAEQRLEQKIEESGKNIIRDLGQFMEEQLFPMIEEKADKSDIERLERKLDVFSAKVANQDTRIKDIESLPAVAHELKLKK